MSDGSNYWTRKTLSRRVALRAAAVGGGLAALSLVGCGGGDDDKKESGQPQTGTADSDKGNPGGRLVMQNLSYHFVNLVIKATPATNTVMGLVHSGLLAYAYGRPPSNGLDATSEPDLAEALPEQVDQVTYRFKLRPAQFHNGRTVTAEDVKYSLERAAFDDQSSVKLRMSAFEKAEAPDATTVVVKTKFPYADFIQSMTADWTCYIMAKEFEESPEATTKMMGSGPFIWASDTPPVQTTFRKNPNYYLKPYPYFDEVVLLGSSDPIKQQADFVSRQVQVPYWFTEQLRDDVKKARPDAQTWSYDNPGLQVYMRTDQDPFKDKRVRQALSMAINRKAIRDAVHKGEGEDDKPLSPTHGPKWGFRKPSEMGASAKFWNFDPQAAKQLLSAAGVKLPLEFPMGHWNATTSNAGQIPVDSATLVQAQWRQAGIANATTYDQNIAQSASTVQQGRYDGAYLFQNAIFSDPGTQFRDQFGSPPEGVKPPTRNYGYVNNPALNAALDKQIGQFNHEERKQTLRQVEDILCDEMYRVLLSTYTFNYFADPSVKNIVVPYFRYAGSGHYVKYWWFG